MLLKREQTISYGIYLFISQTLCLGECYWEFVTGLVGTYHAWNVILCVAALITLTDMTSEWRRKSTESSNTGQQDYADHG